MRPGNHSSNKNRLLETRLKESDRCDRDRENSRLCDQRDECSRCNDDSLRLLGMTSVSRPSQTVSDTLVSRPIYKLQKQQTANCSGNASDDEEEAGETTYVPNILPTSSVQAVACLRNFVLQQQKSRYASAHRQP
ncbi:hypothetical protein RRG08_007754 [Elysia crispata]|uniref:Uncharacterized protein n=1 Tax=Elysia crispata TaxID=231223 RepID=A0AAE0ZED1_9GAST|nr:hypothetical protein RRG08_007754 [Elysia crispata]